jgi:membrane associated rhomboid family serine protease
MSGLLVFLAISGGVAWAAIAATVFALLLCWILDRRKRP